MPDYNPWGTPIFPGASAFGVGSPAEDAQRQPTIVDNLLSHIAGALGRGFMAPGNVLNSPTPLTSEQQMAPARDMMALMVSGGMPMAEQGALGMAGGRLGPSDYLRMLESQRATEGYRAAMRDPQTGKIYSGASHQAAIEKAPAFNEAADEITNGTWGRLSNEWDKATDNTGFIDGRGNFISRSEAEKRYGISTMEDLKDLRKSKTAQFRGGQD